MSGESKYGAPAPSGARGTNLPERRPMTDQESYQIRTLRLSREIWIFLGVTSLMSGVYLTMTTGETARQAVKPESLTPTDLAPGRVIDAGITLITADAFGLSCGSDTKVAGEYHCAFGTNGTAYKSADGAPSKPEQVLSPYMTVDNVLFLIPGLWQQPVLKKRLEDEPPSKFTREQLEERRFTVTCKLKVVEKLQNFKVRWSPTQSWGDRDQAWVGTVTDCKQTGG